MNSFHGRDASQGSTLLISLIFLLILTLLGLASVSTTTLQERMAHNTREMNISFQAAEAALTDAEIWIKELSEGPAPTPASSCANSCADVPVWVDGHHNSILSRDYEWWRTNGREHGYRPETGQDTADLKLVAGQPYYLIEEINTSAMPNLKPQSLSHGHNYTISGPRYYRIYAYGIGQSSYALADETRYFNTLLESIYAVSSF